MKIRRGTSIIEIVVAAALISVAIISALSLANNSQKENKYSRSLAEATKYATQGADWMRTQRDYIGWSTIRSKALADDVSNIATYCLNTLYALPATESDPDFTDLTAGNCAPTEYIANTLFQRQMTIDTSDEISGILKITLNITWLETSSRQATVIMELTKW